MFVVHKHIFLKCIEILKKIFLRHVFITMYLFFPDYIREEMLINLKFFV